MREQAQKIIKKLQDLYVCESGCEGRCKECPQDIVRDAIEVLTASLSSEAALAEAADDKPVEIWNGKRKVTVYRDVVLRVWGTNMDDQMSEAPRTHESVNAALRWLFETPLVEREQTHLHLLFLARKFVTDPIVSSEIDAALTQSQERTLEGAK